MQNGMTQPDANMVPQNRQSSCLAAVFSFLVAKARQHQLDEGGTTDSGAEGKGEPTTQTSTIGDRAHCDASDQHHSAISERGGS
jgi:hypothetical protein